MLKNQRHTEILEILKKQSFATVADLSAKLYASLPTIRRDLTVLEEDGYVKRCHGGAMILDGNTKPPVYFRREHHAQEKLRMCGAAATLISEGDTVFIDASTSVFHIADFIEKEKGITVVTNGLPIATRLAETGIKVYSTGGRLLKESLAFVGISAGNSAASFNADSLFFSVASLSLDGILSDWSEDEAMLRIEMAKNAKRKILLCDSSKIGTTSTFKLFPITEIDYLVTECELPRELTERIALEKILETPAIIYKVK